MLAREQEALTLAQNEALRRRDAEAATQAATAGRIAAERDASAAADARLAAERATRTADDARLTAESEARIAADRQLSAERARATDAENARIAADSARAQADAARVAADAKAQSDAAGAAAQADAARLAADARAQRDAAGAAAKSEQDKAALREQLREQLNVILDTRATARGLIVNLSDVLFDSGRSELKPGAREKLARISGILALHQGLRLEVEGHTDDVGSDDSNQRLSERRGESVRAYLVQQGVVSTTVATIGLGETKPVATNGTAAGRQQNRRVELIVSGESIGTR